MRAVLLTSLEVAFMAIALVGVALVSLPAALILGGIVGVAAIEWSERRAAPRSAAQPPAGVQNGPQGPRSVP